MALSAERREARRRHLVEAAASLIRDNGGAGFSMLQLAERAGVSQATPYNLLGSKSELLRLIVAGELGAGVTLVSELLPTRSRGIGTTIVATVGLTGAVVAGLVGEMLIRIYHEGRGQPQFHAHEHGAVAQAQAAAPAAPASA